MSEHDENEQPKLRFCPWCGKPLEGALDCSSPSETIVFYTPDVKPTVSQPAVSVPEPANAEPHLVIMFQGDRHDVSTFPYTLGRGEDSSLCFSDMGGISRCHASIRKEGNSFLLTDLNSTNGTTVNGVRLLGGETVLLKKGDLVEMGTVRVEMLVENA